MMHEIGSKLRKPKPRMVKYNQVKTVVRSEFQTLVPLTPESIPSATIQYHHMVVI